MEKIQYTHPDDYVTNLMYFPCEMPPKATILILHGMGEHYERYTEFIEFLNNNAIDCYAYNHRGHGKDFTVAAQGNALPGRGYETYVSDVIRIAKHIRQHKRTSAFFLYGHSFGSIISRNVIQKDSDYSGVIVSSTAYFPPLVASGMCILSRICCLFGGKYKRSAFFNNLAFGGKDYQSFEGRTYYDWLSSDNVEVGRYIDDQYCGYTYAKGFYKDLSTLIKLAGTPKRVNKTNKSLPIVLLSGDSDPVSNFAKSVNTIENLYDRLGFTNVSSRIYPDARHEILHDKCRDDVMNDIL